MTAKIKIEIKRAYDNIRRTRGDLYITASLIALIKINKYAIKALIDSGTEIFIIIIDLIE